ncbi:MAG: hypothetical protein K0S65_6443, partial [Labilithrix sp.]|nr:hypothetical protein [Labilithrix sp.]
VPRVRSRRATVALAALTLALAAGDARADAARDVAARVQDQWKGASARTVAVPTRFVFDDETILVPIPPEPEGEESACTQVAVVGARGLSFRARLSDAPMDPLLPPEPTARASSTAGVLELRRCERGRPPVRHIVVTAEGGRGAVEIIVGRSDRPLPLLATLIPERTGGAIPPATEAGSLPPLVTQEKRADAAEVRARRDGAIVGDRTRARAGDDGTGEEDIDLDEGCHRIELFGREATRDRPGRRFRLDVDAELRDGDQLLARDRTEAPDARLETCVGSSTRVSLVYAGSPPHSDVVVTHGSWPLPARLPPIWGPVTRSKMARVMFLRHVAVPADDPVYLAQGATGTTPLALPVETGGCYVAVVGVARGHARQLQLRALVGARESTDERGASEEAALVSFCARAHESARVEVLARGTGVSWGLALFRVKSGVWETGR